MQIFAHLEEAKQNRTRGQISLGSIIGEQHKYSAAKEFATPARSH
jgi:hypothetical protein